MDCAVEEGVIRNALDRVEGIRRLNFQLASRTLAIDASAEALNAALAAIQKAGFDPQPVLPGTVEESDSKDRHDHTETATPWRLALSLVLAIAAEAIEFLLPDLLLAQGAIFALAAIAVWLAGVDTYTKGFSALKRGKHNQHGDSGKLMIGTVIQRQNKAMAQCREDQTERCGATPI